MSITVHEQSDLRVGVARHQDGATLSPEQAQDLVDFSEYLGARVVSWQSPTSLRVQQFVGYFRVGSLHLEILPKLSDRLDTSGIRRNLVEMLARTQDLNVRSSEIAAYFVRDEPFIAAIARLYCRKLLEAVRRGLRQGYVERKEVLSSLRGKLQMPAQVRLHAKQSVEFACVFDERSEDTLLNRTLKAALLECGRLLEGSSDASLIVELRHAMDGVADAYPNREQLARLQTDRTNRHLRPLLALAKLILGGSNPDVGRSAAGDRSTYSVVWDMNVLFEEYLGRVAKSTFVESNYFVDLQEEGAVYLATEVKSRRDTFLLTPDIVVRKGTEVSAVADTKWKTLQAGKRDYGVSIEDVYQVLAYAHSHRTGTAVLVFPHAGRLRAPGVQTEFVVADDSKRSVRIRLLTVDLGALETIPNQLRTGLMAVGSAAVMTADAPVGASAPAGM